MEQKNICILFVGRSQAGKTTLTQYMTRQELNYHKTQTIEVVDGHLIDTPGEYMEQRSFYGALSVTATNADVIALVQSATEEGTMFAPGFGMMFCGKPIIGIITKLDLVSQEQAERAERNLEQAGAAIRFKVSSVTGQGMDDLDKWVQEC